MINTYGQSSHGLTVHRMESLYELSFLRSVLAWESFLEETFSRALCGFTLSNGVQSLVGSPFPNLASAEAAVLGSRDFVSWTDTGTVIRRCRTYIRSGDHEAVISSAATTLDNLASIRHRIAHRSEYARSQFDIACRAFIGRTVHGSVPGKLLRAWNTSVMPNERWLYTLTGALRNFASQIV